MALLEQPIWQALTVPEADTSVALCSLVPALRTFSNDASKLAKNGTVTGARRMQGNGAALDGDDDKIAYGDLGVNLVEVSMWANPATTSEVLFRVDTAKFVHIVSGVVTYSGLTASATYVDGAASTAMVASKWQHVVCQFTAMDANSLDLAYDGTNFGYIEVRGLVARTTVRTAAQIAVEFKAGCPDASLILAVDGRGRDLSRFRRTVTASGGVVLGKRIVCDGINGMLDAGDAGNITEVSFWVNPTAVTQQLFRVDTGKSVSTSGSTITYTGLTASATYVDGAAGTTLTAGKWSHVVCQFAQVDANNLELGTDGTDYGACSFDQWCVRTSSRSAAAIAVEYAQT